MAHAAARTGAAAAATAARAFFSGLLKGTVQYTGENCKKYGSYYDRSKVVYYKVHNFTPLKILPVASQPLAGVASHIFDVG